MTEHETPTHDLIQVVNTIPATTLEKAADARERVGVYLGMADLAFLSLIEAGGEPDTVSMALAPGTRKETGAPVIVATFSALKPVETTEEPTA